MGSRRKSPLGAQPTHFLAIRPALTTWGKVVNCLIFKSEEVICMVDGELERSRIKNIHGLLSSSLPSFWRQAE